MIIKIDHDRNKILHEFIHKNFGKKSGLMSHEYCVFFDVELTYNNSVVDYIVSAGKTIHIALRCYPASETMVALCKLVFLQDLRKFLRLNRSLVLKKDADNWKTLAVKEPEITILKRIKDSALMNAFERRTITSVELKDKKTHKVVVVEIVNGNLFRAQDLALKELYGDRF